MDHDYVARGEAEAAEVVAEGGAGVKDRIAHRLDASRKGFDFATSRPCLRRKTPRW
jgi:hypothetical protein